MFATSAALVRDHCWPSDSTTRTLLAPTLAISAEGCWVRLVYQAWGWLTPRMTKTLPLPSSKSVADTSQPASAPRAAAKVLTSNNVLFKFLMPRNRLGCVRVFLVL